MKRIKNIKTFFTLLIVVMAIIGGMGFAQYLVSHAAGNKTAVPIVCVSAASYRDASLAPESIIAAFGSNLATTTESAKTQPLPTILGGTTVKVRDSQGVERPAPLFFVSPDQVNYQMPVGSASGQATITITNGNGVVSTGTSMISTVGPGVFAANSDGQGVAAALALRVNSTGEQFYDPVAHFDPNKNRFVAAAFDPGTETEECYLILFGTGLGNRIAPAEVAATIDGVDALVAYAGSMPDFTGLDQINLEIPKSLIGRGEVVVQLAVDGQAANPVKVNIGGPAAYFLFDSPPRTETFVIKLNDPAMIQHARDVISGKATSLKHVMGLIVKSKEPYNSPWSYHLNPASITFFDSAIEVCDGAIPYVEEHLDEAGGAFLPGLRWCPWGSRLVKELPATVR